MVLRLVSPKKKIRFYIYEMMKGGRESELAIAIAIGWTEKIERTEVRGDGTA